jgi:hypothetical protein
MSVITNPVFAPELAASHISQDAASFVRVSSRAEDCGYTRGPSNVSFGQAALCTIVAERLVKRLRENQAASPAGQSLDIGRLLHQPYLKNLASNSDKRHPLALSIRNLPAPSPLQARKSSKPGGPAHGSLGYNDNQSHMAHPGGPRLRVRVKQPASLQQDVSDGGAGVPLDDSAKPDNLGSTYQKVWGMVAAISSWQEEVRQWQVCHLGSPAGVGRMLVPLAGSVINI